MYEDFLETSSLLEFFGICSPIWNIMNFFEHVANSNKKKERKCLKKVKDKKPPNIKVAWNIDVL